LIDKRRHSNILDVRSFRGADCDTDHYLVVVRPPVRKVVVQASVEELNMGKKR
jgi:hypothetical protein